MSDIFYYESSLNVRKIQINNELMLLSEIFGVIVIVMCHVNVSKISEKNA